MPSFRMLNSAKCGWLMARFGFLEKPRKDGIRGSNSFVPAGLEDIYLSLESVSAPKLHLLSNHLKPTIRLIIFS